MIIDILNETFYKYFLLWSAIKIIKTMPGWGEKNLMLTNRLMQSLSSLPLYLEVYLEHVGSTCLRLGHTVRSTLNETWLNDSTPLPNSGIDIVPSTLDIRLVFYKSIRIYLFSSKQNSKRISFIFVYRYCFHCIIPLCDRPFLCMYVCPSFSRPFVFPLVLHSITSYRPFHHLILSLSISRALPSYRIYRGFDNW